MSDFLANQLERMDDFHDVSYSENVTVQGRNAKDVFCNGWPAAKTVLESIAAMIKNPIVKVIIGIVIKAGDALSAKICA